jgi:hypothetical protein
MSGSHCPVCLGDAGVDAEDWFRDHEHRDLAVCAGCDARLKAYWDDAGEGGFWAFEAMSRPAG